jgi:hypothetical protein
MSFVASVCRWLVVSDVLNDRNSFETSETIEPITQRDIIEDYSSETSL